MLSSLVMTVLFTYAKSPVDIRPYGESPASSTARVRSVTYGDPLGGRIPAYIVTPLKRTSSMPAIIYAHWCLGDRAEFLPEAIQMAARGFVSILPDGPEARPAPWTQPPSGNVKDPYSDRRLYVRAVVDLRRAVDVLASLPQVDTRRISFVGHSCSAGYGGILSGVEPRIADYILMGGSGSYSDLSRQAFQGAFYSEQGYQYISHFSRTALKHYADVVAPLDPSRYVAHSNKPKFLQFAYQDAYTNRYSAEQYAQSASVPKKVTWYIGGHELDCDRCREERIAWLLRWADR